MELGVQRLRAHQRPQRVQRDAMSSICAASACMNR